MAAEHNESMDSKRESGQLSSSRLECGGKHCVCAVAAFSPLMITVNPGRMKPLSSFKPEVLLSGGWGLAYHSLHDNTSLSLNVIKNLSYRDLNCGGNGSKKKEQLKYCGSIINLQRKEQRGYITQQRPHTQSSTNLTDLCEETTQAEEDKTLKQQAEVSLTITNWTPDSACMELKLGIDQMDL